MRIQRTMLLVALAATTMAAPAAAKKPKSDGTKPMPAKVRAALAGVTQETLDAVGVSKLDGQETFGRRKLSGDPLTKDGKPELLAGFLEWCPHCAANSWSLVIALQKFGTFKGLRILDTGTYFQREAGGSKTTKHTKGVSFAKSTFTSDYLAFVPVVVQDRNGKFKTKLTKKLNAQLGNPQSFPAANFGGLYATEGAAFDPELLGGPKRTWLQVAATANDPNDPLGQGIDSAANLFTAMICAMTGDQPAEVCSTAAVTAAKAALPA